MGIVKLRIQETAKARGVTTAYQLQVKVGFYPSHAAKLFKNEATNLDLETIARLCDALDCQPGDLLEFVQDKKGKK